MTRTSIGSNRLRRPPTILLDRCVTPRVGDALKKFGFRVHTLAEVYGAEASMSTTDIEWIQRCSEEGWIGITANPRIWTVIPEREAIIEGRVKVFCLSNPNHTTETRSMILGRWIPTMTQRAKRPGGCFWKLDPQSNSNKPLR